MKDNKELNVINDEELEDVNAGLMSKGTLAAIIGSSIAGAAILATAIGVPLSKKAKKDKAAKAAASAPVTPEAPTETVKPTAPATAPVQSQQVPNVSPTYSTNSSNPDKAFVDSLNSEPEILNSAEQLDSILRHFND